MINNDFLWEGKPLQYLSNEELIEALKQCLLKLTELQSIAIDYREIVQTKKKEWTQEAALED